MQAAVTLFERASSFKHFVEHFPRTISSIPDLVDSVLDNSQSVKHEHENQELNYIGLTIDNSHSIKEDIEEEPKRLCGRIEKLKRGDPVRSAFQSWMGDGFPVHRGDIFHIIHRLRQSKFNKRALEILNLLQVMEWVIREIPYMPKQLDYSYLLEFTAKLHGISQGEKLFLYITSEFQDELLYNNLLIAYLDKGMLRISLAYMKKCRNSVIPSLTWFLTA